MSSTESPEPTVPRPSPPPHARASAFPPELERGEGVLLRRRRKLPAGDENASEAELGPRLGVGLSGGGIRSATFCLGVFQSLARRDRLLDIDYLSTVSGGGYFGAFYRALFCRKIDAAPADVLTGTAAPAVLRHLRENGRYLAPNGSGDLLLAGAALLRNWLAVTFVVVVSVLTVFVGCQWLTLEVLADLERLAADLWPEISTPRWWGLTLPGAAALWVVPLLLGVAYWMRIAHARLVSAAMILLGAGLSVASVSVAWSHDQLAVVVAGVVLSAICVCAFLLRAGFWLVWRLFVVVDRESCTREEVRAWLNNRLSWALGRALLICGLLTAIAAIDTAARLVYSGIINDQVTSWVTWAVGLTAGTTGAAGLARKLTVYLSSKLGDRLPLSLEIVVSLVAGFAIVSGMLGLAVVAYAISYPLEDVAHSPFVRATYARRWVDIDSSVPRNWFFALAGLSLIIGHGWSFLLNSSHHPLYRARLTRAYLGASNTTRHDRHRAVVHVVAGDDLSLAEYHHVSAYDRQAPLHLLNVTVNETVDGQSQIQQQDRKGTGLAVGPCGFSLGVRHHALRAWSRASDTALTTVLPRTGYRAFAPDNDAPRENTDYSLTAEQLSVGRWVAISGAAFSTGLGYRTSFALSLLAGLANVRLGYWWQSGSGGSALRLWERPFCWLFPVHALLFSEFLARFRGTAGDRWYVTDGGHFENMGGYELIRRRLESIVIVDAEADTGYEFEGLSNLVRKARLDFGAEIEFVGHDELDYLLFPSVRPYFGTLEELRRGPRDEEERIVDGRRQRVCVVQTTDNSRYSLAHAALARVTYTDERSEGRVERWLLYIKPTLTGDEPADVAHYHATHKSFPHETTIDQFFDEAQWESYRRLGQHIGDRVFAVGKEPKGGNWIPAALFQPRPRPGKAKQETGRAGTPAIA